MLSTRSIPGPGGRAALRVARHRGQTRHRCGGCQCRDHRRLLGDGDVALLENVRFEAAEESKDEAERSALAKEYAAFGDIFVSDGFGVVHRKQASVYDVAKLLPGAAGYLVAKEVDVLRRLTESPERPFVVVLGGAKVADKLSVIDNLLKMADTLVIGGGMAFTFLKAQGHDIGNSLVDDTNLEACRGYLESAEAAGKRILLPVDVRVAEGMDFGARTVTGPVDVVPATAIPVDRQGLDIGPESEKVFAEAIRLAKTVFWNGPMGVFEIDELSSGTAAVAKALTAVDGLSVVGGGDPRLLCAASATPTMSSAIFPRAVAPRWNSSRARNCPVSPCWKKERTDDPQADHGRQLEDEPRPRRGHRHGAEAGVDPGGQGVQRQVRRVRRCPAVHRPSYRADAHRR